MQNFPLISNPLKKFLKNSPQKSYEQKPDRNMHFFTDSHVHRSCFAYNLFC
jgi:hypothetical protein